MEMIARRSAAAACLTVMIPALSVTGLGPREVNGQPLRIARPNVLFVVVDTTRADRFFGPRGAARALARQPGTAFTNAWSQAPTTNSSMATIFTGLLPSQHRVFDGGSELPRQATTLAEHFRSAGYATAHITANPNSGPPYGLDRGFQHVRWSSRGEGSDLLHQQLQHAQSMTALALEFLESAASPFLLSLHFNDPHSPYDPIDGPPQPAGVRRVYDEPSSDPSAGAITARERADMLTRYDAEIATVDRALAQIVAALQRKGAWDRTILVVTADHGEEFEDHGGWGHSHSLHPELLRVPLFIRVPGDRARRAQSGRVNHADLLPTVLELAGLPPGARMWGRSRAALVRGQGRAAAFTIAEKLSKEKGAPLSAIVTDAHALIERAGDGHVELYDRRTDPNQRHNVASSREADVRRLKAELSGALGTVQRTEGEKTAAIDPDTLRHLQSLGYLQGRQATAGSAPESPSRDADAAIRAILGHDPGGPAVWTASGHGSRIAGDSSPRAFKVEVTITAAKASGPVRLRFAAAAHPTTISAVTLRAQGARAEPVTFARQAARRIPAGGVVETDALRLAGGGPWVVTFHSSPLALVRVSGAGRTTLTPIDAGAGAGTIDGSLGLIAVAASER